MDPKSLDQILWEAYDDGCQRIEADLRRFIGPLNAWIRNLLSRTLPPDWRQRLGAYLDSWEPAGFEIDPPEHRKLERWIENWAKLLYVWPREPPTATRPAPKGGIQFAMRPAPHRPTQREISEQFFNTKLATAERCLAEIEQLLRDLGARIDSAQLESDVDVDQITEQVESLIWSYQDALESARAAWLRDDLSGDANERLIAMRTPLSLGLPHFTDEAQQRRAAHQELEISRRLGARNVTMDLVIVGMQTVEVAGDVAGLLLGGGVLVVAYKKGGKWAVVKTVAKGAAGAAWRTRLTTDCVRRA